MKFKHVLAAVAALLSSGVANAAAFTPQIRYEFTALTSFAGKTGSFVYTSDDFMTQYTIVSAAALDSCVVFTPAGSSCSSQEFQPTFFGSSDRLAFGVDGLHYGYNFAVGAFATLGFHETKEFGAAQFGTLRVSEVTGAVPEPESWALMIVGFGLVGAAARRRADRAVLSR